MPLEDETIISRSPEETRNHGILLARTLSPGDLVAFRGDLGSGKTCMIQGICQGLEVSGQVNSPTFILINEYRGILNTHPIPVYHFDLYRLNTQSELEDLGAEEYFYGPGICLVEWSERAGDLLPSRRRDMSLEYISDTERRITSRLRIP